ncbi:MAG: DALR domain-containing protein, partial [Chthoniobacterales bacterium]
GKKFVRYWMHCAHLLVDGQKMSKSLGNFYTLRDVLEKGYMGREVRYALLRVHYRAQLNFTWDGMNEARQSLGRIDEWLERLRVIAGQDKSEANIPEGFEEALDDDLNVSAALAFLFDKIRETNRSLDQGRLTPAGARGWLDWWNRIDSVLAVSGGGSEVPTEVSRLSEARAQARLAKDWRKSDELRDQIAALGWEVRDGKDGQKLTRRSGA